MLGRALRKPLPHGRGSFGILLAACSLLAAQETTPAAIPALVKDGNASYLKGDYEAARQTFLNAWELAQKTPKDDPLRYDVLKRLTSVRAAAGEFADADEWLQQAITWRETNLGQRDPKIPDDLLISVGFCRARKDFDRALAILRQVQALHVAIYTFDSSMVADDFHRMALVYIEQKQAEPAINSLNAARAIRTKLAGPLDPTLVPDLDKLGELHTQQRAYDAAEADFRHALVIRETLYGKVHADLISTVDGLAYALFGQQHYDAAEPVYQRLLALWESSVGKEHPMIAVVLDKIGVFYAEQKKYEEARAALERSTAVRARFHAMGLSQQATEAFTEHQLDQAKAFYQRALAALDPPNPMNAEMREKLEAMVKALEAPLPKPGTPLKRASPPPKTDAPKKP
jgi:tetratricopeptide (TPR) repeat protein